MQNVTYQTLNGLRGIAALVVVSYHFSTRHLFGSDRGFIAVDLFFVLSGFVIANAYDRRLASGMSVREFFLIRLIRLYPLYALGTTIGAVALVCSPTLGGQSGVSHLEAFRQLLCSFLMLPTPVAAGVWANAPLYPLDDPAWSLFFELLINLVYAASYKAWTIKRLVALIAISLIGFACIYAATGTLYGNGGWDWSSLPFGVVRVTYAFSFGVLIERLKPRLVRLSSIWSFFVVALFPALLLSPGTIWLFASILFGMPLLVALAVAAEPSPAIATLFRLAGTISYPLYAIHKPVHALVALAVEKVGVRVPIVSSDVLLTAFLVLIAFYLEQAYDRPLRAILSGKLRGGLVTSSA